MCVWNFLQIGIVHGEMTKICPHTSTGRADYFGSVVNRAARLLCAANAGQTLVEALVMDDVLKQWSGEAYRLAPMPLPDCIVSTKGISALPPFGGEATLGAGIVQSGALPLPDLEALTGEQSVTPRTKSAPQLRPLSIPGDGSDPATADKPSILGLELTAAKDVALARDSTPLEPSQAGRSGGLKGWTPRAPHAGMRSSLAHGRATKQAVSFAPSSGRESRTSSIASFSPRRSIDGVSYDDSEMEQLPVTESCCAPFAAGSPLAVSNCHMLKFLAAAGTLHGRQEDAVAPKPRAHGLVQRKTLSADDSPRSSQELPSCLSIRSDSSGTSNGGSRRNSLKLSAETKGLNPTSSGQKSRGMKVFALPHCFFKPSAALQETLTAN